MKKPDLIHPLHCWDVYTMQKYNSSEINQDHLSQLLRLKEQYDWRVDLQSLLSLPYDALVLTDRNIIIQWVSQDFQYMTGYAPSFALGKSPKILQGKNTSPVTLKAIRQKLQGKTSFTETLVNYKKTGEEYLCRVEIHPIENAENEITHFLALEMEVDK